MSGFQPQQLQGEDLITVLESARDLVGIADANGRTLYFNQAARRTLGFSDTEDLSHKTIAEYHPPEAARILREEAFPIALQNGSWAGETTLLTKNGEEIAASQIIVTHKNPDGSLKFISTILRDITEPKAIEDQLRRSNALLKAQQEALIDGILVADEHRNIVDYNQKFCEIWRLPQILSTQNSRQIAEWVADQVTDREAFLANIETLYQNLDEVFHDELLLKDGRTIERHSKAVKSSTGEYYGRITFFRDISDRKRTEAALQQSEQHFRNIVENANDILFVNTPEGIFTYVSPNVSNVMGFMPEEMIGQPFTQFLHPDDVELCFNRNRQIVDTRKPQSGLEFRSRYKDGNFRWQVVNIAAGTGANGELQIIGVARDIHDRKVAEEALRRSEARYRAFMTATAQAVWMTNANGEVIEDIPLWCALTGRSEASARGWGWLESIHPDDRTSTAQIWQEAVNSGKIYQVEQRIQVASGEYRLFAVRGVPIFDDQGKLQEWIGTKTDISDRKAAEEALRQQNALLQAQQQALQEKEAQYRSIFEAIADGLFILDLETSNVVEVNPAVCQMHGYRYEEMLSIHPSAYLSPSTFQGFQESMQWMREPGARFSTEGTHINKKGDSFAVDIQGTRCIYNGKPHVLSIVRDISERKATEEALKHRAELDHLLSYISRQLIDQEAEVAIRMALESITRHIGAERGAIFEYDANHTRCQLLYEWCGEDIAPLTPAARGSSVPEYPLLHQQFLSGQPLYTADVQMIPEGPERQLFTHQSIQSVLGVPMIYQGKVTGFIGIDAVHFRKEWTQEDINSLKLFGELIAIGQARHKAETDLRLAKEAAEAANLAKSTFLANMSHELRTPLNAILGFSQLLERDVTLSERQRDSLAIINRSGEHLLNLINDVLEMSKIEAGRTTLNVVSFDLHHLLQTLQEMFLIRAKAKKLVLNFAIAPNLPQYIQTDENKLRQVLINLLGNAIKFTDQGSITLQATISELTLQFKIQDSGRGIAKEEFKDLFRPFIQTSSGSQLREGTGLGLTISRRFVQLMGGDIQVESTVGQGATFYFEIQIAIAALTEVAPIITSKRVLQLTSNQPPYRILIVDDRSENRDFVEQLLTMVGFETRSSVNGVDAIAQWQQWQPHLILMDMRMPVMDGYEATRRIRAMESDSTRSKILALTASAFEEQRALILAAGCDDLLAKPFREARLFEKLAEHLSVNYLYEEDENSESASSQALTRSKLSTMPQAWITQLHQASLAVDADRILQLIQQIPESDQQIAIALAELVQQFNFDEIAELSQSENCTD